MASSGCPRLRVEMRLNFVDRGKCQIVFTGEAPEVVYKLPMAARYLSAVDEAREKAGKPLLAGRKTWSRRSRLRIQLVVNHRAMRRSATILERLNQTTPGGCRRFFPDTRVVSLDRAELIVGSRSFRYSGFALQQARVSDFFERDTPLASFDWDELRGVVTGLWRQGVGLVSVADTWGQKNWGHDAQGRVRLIDTSHLSEDREKVAGRVAPGATAALQRKMVVEGAGNPEQVRSYFESLARDFNPECLRALWRRDLDSAGHEGARRNC